MKKKEKEKRSKKVEKEIKMRVAVSLMMFRRISWIFNRQNFLILVIY